MSLPRPPNPSLYGLADVLEPSQSGASSVTRPGVVGAARVDFAFADTVQWKELEPEEIVPASGPMIVRDETGARRMHPLAFPPPAPAPPSAPAAPITVRARAAVKTQVDEIKELWRSTEDCIVVEGEPETAIDRARVIWHRLRALWSFWEWDRTDMIRAAVIGIAVFLAAATIALT